MARQTTLQNWARAEFGDDAPTINTLTRWAREGWITPLPTKIGRTWFVIPQAQYRPPSQNHSEPAAKAIRSGNRLINRIPQ
ncbi:excisionase [Deefgea piscis]|uniref:Excisionase n=1 Tax=Deefgea piscis TaxID=2739061 RepID=A0A6M8STK8_9NEIS|nr:excisionase [Deefgea piscis]QKJ67454.1 excisionase [Deefgea piscis]